jgi:hypothetical protein
MRKYKTTIQKALQENCFHPFDFGNDSGDAAAGSPISFYFYISRRSEEIAAFTPWNSPRFCQLKRRKVNPMEKRVRKPLKIIDAPRVGHILNAPRPWRLAITRLITPVVTAGPC